jgi:hypothetical protein
MKVKHRLALTLLGVVALSGAGIGIAAADSGGGGSARSSLADAVQATAGFHDIAVAKAAGYGLFTDAKGIACIDMPAMPGMAAGAMGIHFVKGALVGDGDVDASTPEAVVYEPEKNGQMRLVALEYVVLQADWNAKHSSPPSLFGQEFNFTPAGNRYDLPPFYSLHAWIWKHNPTGMFSMFNPEVSCAAG